MCVTSFVGDFYGKTAPAAPVPVYIPWPDAAPASLPWTPEAFTLLQEIMAKLKVLDDKLGLAQCENPEKTAWMAEVERRLDALATPRRSRRKVGRTR